MDEVALQRPKITVAASQRLRPDPVSCESKGWGDGGGEIRSDLKKAWTRTHISYLAVASRGQGTAAHIRGRDPAAAKLCSCVPNPEVVLLCLAIGGGGS